MNKINLFYFCCLILFCSCKKEELYLDIKNSKDNYFNIKKTGYSVYGNHIYYMDKPISNMHESFIWNNYFFLSNNKIYEIFLHNNCIEHYKKGKYFFDDKIKKDKIYLCSVKFVPVVDFNLKLKDSFIYVANNYLFLDKKIFSNNDTIYKYIRKYGGENNKRTVILTSKKRGFVGVYDSIIGKNEKINPIGLTFTNVKSIKKYKFEKLDLDLGIIKEFDKE